MKRNAKALGATVAMLIGLTLTASAAPVSERDSAPGLLLESYKLPITPPRDQGESDLCWVFATLSMLETNNLSRHPGVQVEYSRGALQRASIVDRFERWLRGESRHLEDGGRCQELPASAKRGDELSRNDAVARLAREGTQSGELQ